MLTMIWQTNMLQFGLDLIKAFDLLMHWTTELIPDSLNNNFYNV